MRGAGGRGEQELGGDRSLSCPVRLSVLQRPGYLHEHELVGVGEEDDRVLHRVVIVLVLLLAG